MSEIKQWEKHITLWWFLKYVSFSQETDCWSTWPALVPVILKRSPFIIHARLPLMSIAESEREDPGRKRQSSSTRPVYLQSNLEQFSMKVDKSGLDCFLSATNEDRIHWPWIKVPTGKVKGVRRDAACIKNRTDRTCHTHLAREHLDPSCRRPYIGPIECAYTKEHPLRWSKRNGQGCRVWDWPAWVIRSDRASKPPSSLN